MTLRSAGRRAESMSKEPAKRDWSEISAFPRNAMAGQFGIQPNLHWLYQYGISLDHMSILKRTR